MRFTTTLTLAALATTVFAHLPAKRNVFELAGRDKNIAASFGTSPGCGAYCPVCGDETCVCGSSKGSSVKPCCNGYRSPKGINQPSCVAPSITGNPNTHDKREAPATQFVSATLLKEVVPTPYVKSFSG